MPFNQTSFKKGHKRSIESILKQIKTMKTQYKKGERTPPKTIWTKKLKKQMIKKNREAKLKRFPIGSKRKHLTGKNLFYWVVKTSDRGRWRYEHRVIKELKLGRKLKRNEVIHHINNNSLDNRISNLKILSHSEHMRIHNKERRDALSKRISKT